MRRRRRTRRTNKNMVNKWHLVPPAILVLGISFGLALCIIQPRTGHNLVIEQQDKRVDEILTEAYQRCPKGTEGFYVVRETERRIDEKIKQLEDKLKALSMTSNMGLWEIQSITLGVKNAVDEAEDSLKMAGCIRG